MLDADDTIAAAASAPGGALRGIVRASGPRAADCIAELLADEADRAALAALRRPTCLPATLCLPSLGAPLPCDLFVWPDARSYTRAPTVEVHLVGSPPLVEAVLEAACRAGARPARPGEFTLRAFLAGRIDLTQAEAVLGVIDAADRRQLDAALDQLAGGLARPLAALRGDLLDLVAELEAGLDFVEEDIEFIGREELASRLQAARDAVKRILGQLGTRGSGGMLPRVVLVGAPNAGKSSLFNALVGRHAALVSPLAGTTRDYLTAELSLSGTALELVDTAGLAQTSRDVIDAAAQRTATAQAESAALTLLCIDGTAPPPARDDVLRLANPQGESLVVWTKSDLPAAAATEHLRTADDVVVSAAAGRGLDRLAATIAARLRGAAIGDVVAGTAVRCRESLLRAEEALAAAMRITGERHGEELIAAEVRLALDELGQVLGTVYTDDILDRIFSRFCIGK